MDYTQKDIYPDVLLKIKENMKESDDDITFDTFEEFKKWMDSL